MIRAAVIAFAILAAGCASTGPAPQQVKVPVPVYCDPPEIPAPVLPIDQLAADADEFEVARALWATVEVLEAHAIRLRSAIDSCRSRGLKPPPRVS